MPITCTRCEGSGFINMHQIPDDELDHTSDSVVELVQCWITKNPESDVQICDCCGNGQYWYGKPGEHYNTDDPIGSNGPYSYNLGLCECH